MDLMWLEDLLGVAEKGHFARAAEARNVSQSALTRRIQALERWAGAQLLDRSVHPVTLTPEGRIFAARAREIVGRASQARAELREQSKPNQARLNIACLHTLALNYVPELLCDLQQDLGAFQTTVVAETRTVDEYLDALARNRTDMFLCFTHPQVPLGINMDGFSHLELGHERLAPYQAANAAPVDLDDPDGPPIRYLEYGATAFLSRLAECVIGGAPFQKRLEVVYRASLAESLSSAASRNMGIAWLPESIAEPAVREGRLAQAPGRWWTQMTILAFRSDANQNAMAAKVWAALSERVDRMLQG